MCLYEERAQLRWNRGKRDVNLVTKANERKLPDANTVARAVMGKKAQTGRGTTYRIL